MAELLRAVKADTGHSHIAYLGDNGEGETTKTSDHKHRILDQVMEPGPDGHTHELEPLAEKDPWGWIKDEDEKEVAAELFDLYKKFKSQEGDSIEKGDESWDFYMQKQWPEEDMRTLKLRKRACLTINELTGLVNLIVGFQKQNQTDPMLRPFEQSDERSAEVGNILLKHIFNANGYQDEKTDVFKDEVIAGRGLFHVLWDETSGEEGDIRIEQMLWKKAVFGPHEKRDCRDLEAVCLTDWLSMHKVKRIYPDKADQIDLWVNEYEPADVDNQPPKALAFEPGMQKHKDEPYNGQSEEDSQLIAKKDIRTFELWRKEYTRAPIMKVKRDGFVEDLSSLDVSSKELRALKEIDGVEIDYIPRTAMRVTKQAGMVLLEDEIIDTEQFELIPAYAYKYKENFLGWVEALKDPAMEVNKRHSQVTDAMNSIGGSRFIKRGAMKKTELDKYMKHGGEWDKLYVLEETADKNPIFREAQIDIPQILVQMEQFSSEKMRDISNMRDISSMMGQGQSNMSGRALMIQRRNALTGNDFLFDHLKAAERIVAIRAIELAQENYSLERIKRIIQPQNTQRQMDGEMLITDEDIMRFKENKGLTKYDIVIEDSAHSKTMQEFVFMIMSEMAQQGVEGIDSIAILENSPFPASVKSSLIQGVQQARQMQAQQEQAKHQTEIQKSQPNEVKMAQAGMPVPQQGGF